MQRFSISRNSENQFVVVDTRTGARERVESTSVLTAVELMVPASLPSQKVCVIST